MLMRKLVPFLVVLIVATVVGASVTPLGKADYVVTYTPTGDTLEIKKALSFTPENAQVYLEHFYPTNEDYIAGVTVYSKDYVTGRGVRVGDPAEKVIELYGEPHRYSGSREHYKWISYTEQSQVLKVHFYLDKETGLVVAINMNVYPVSAPPLIKLADGKYH